MKIQKKRCEVEFQGPFQFESLCSRYSEGGRVQSYSDWTTGWTIEELGFDSQQGQAIFLFSTTALEPLPPHIILSLRNLGADSLSVK